MIKSLNKLELLQPAEATASPMRISFKQLKRSAERVVQISNLTDGYEEQLLFLEARATIQRGDKIALIGANGKGKTTLLNLIAGKKQPIEGEIKLGHQVAHAFYAQHQLQSLNPKHTILEALIAVNQQESIQALRRLLGAFLFIKEQVDKPIAVLSGGEKARVALAKMIVQNPNFLLLDEPTNHLDMISEDVLAQALRDYPGTLLLVSHNRGFISKVANKIWYIEEGQIRSYSGNYEAYLFSKSEKLANRHA